MTVFLPGALERPASRALVVAGPSLGTRQRHRARSGDTGTPSATLHSRCAPQEHGHAAQGAGLSHSSGDLGYGVSSFARSLCRPSSRSTAQAAHRGPTRLPVPE